MDSKTIYKDIETRTGGDIYIGVVGPVRTGKSTFIKRFMDTLVLPNMKEDFKKERAVDEMPQSSAGRTIMTTEPKFIPEDAAELELPQNAKFRVRMIDCVGYIVPSSIGYIENEAPRMVRTPWFEEDIPFNMAAEIGTAKVINEHSTIGLVVTTDGSISDIPRFEYEEAEERVINELKEIKKPFIILLNCTHPRSAAAAAMAAELSEKYNATVAPVNCLELDENEIKDILTHILFEFPIKEIEVGMPEWLLTLKTDHWLKSKMFSSVIDMAKGLESMKAVNGFAANVSRLEYITDASVTGMNLGVGSAKLAVTMENGLFYKILSEFTGLSINTEQDLMSCLTELSEVNRQYRHLKDAIDEVEATGYGIVMPGIDELTLEEPEIMKHGGKYGVRLKASAPSIHIECIERQFQIRKEYLPCRCYFTNRLSMMFSYTH